MLLLSTTFVMCTAAVEPEAMIGRASDWQAVADALADEINPKWRQEHAKPSHHHPVEKASGVSDAMLYGPLLAPLRYEPVTMLEIGIKTGNSQTLWRRYFSKARMIVGLGLPPPAGKVTGDSVRTASNNKLVYCDQINATCLSDLGATDGPFDLIIDDAAHVPQVRASPSEPPRASFVFCGCDEHAPQVPQTPSAAMPHSADTRTHLLTIACAPTIITRRP